MLGIVLTLLIILWILGFIQIPGFTLPNIVLFVINGKDITLLNLLIFGLIASLLGLLPSPLNLIAGVALVLWVLAVLGFIAVGGLSQILVLAVIIGLVLFVLGGF